MNLALKDVGNVKAILGKSALAESRLWSGAVDQIGPTQLAAFQARMDMQGRHDEGAVVLRTLMSELGKAAHAGQIKMTNLLDYMPRAKLQTITTQEILSALSSTTKTRAAAILFALEAKLEPGVATALTWDEVKPIAQSGGLSGYARHILNSQVRHIRFCYVFWEIAGATPKPVFGLSHEVFDLFGMTWPELALAYENLSLDCVEFDAAELISLVRSSK